MSGNVSEVRKRSAERLADAGFRFAQWLPVRGEDEVALRPTADIAGRFAALSVLCVYVSAPEDLFPTANLMAVVDRLNGRSHLTSEEAATLDLPREDANAAHAHTIGWQMENQVSLAWVLGHSLEPGIDGQMIDGKDLKAILAGIMPLDAEGAADWFAAAQPRSAKEVAAMEDLFYCCHNAVRSAQLQARPSLLGRIRGEKPSVPKGFDPVANGGVIHERRHALTWCLSPGVRWEQTDLST